MANPEINKETDLAQDKQGSPDSGIQYETTGQSIDILACSSIRIVCTDDQGREITDRVAMIHIVLKDGRNCCCRPSPSGGWICNDC